MDEEKKQPKVLVIDDDEDLMNMLVYALESENCLVQGISTGKEALEYLNDKNNRDSLSLVILDRILTDMDGMEILKALEKFNDHSLPVVVLSMLSSEPDVLAGLKHGAVDYITKPFSISVLKQKVRSILSRYH